MLARRQQSQSRHQSRSRQASRAPASFAGRQSAKGPPIRVSQERAAAGRAADAPRNWRAIPIWIWPTIGIGCPLAGVLCAFLWIHLIKIHVAPSPNVTRSELGVSIRRLGRISVDSNQTFESTRVGTQHAIQRRAEARDGLPTLHSNRKKSPQPWRRSPLPAGLGDRSDKTRASRIRRASRHDDGAAQRPLFNGIILDGWEGPDSCWRVEQGMLIGAVSPDRQTLTVLRTKANYKDFDLRFRVKLKDGAGNCAVQFPPARGPKARLRPEPGRPASFIG